MISVLLRVRLIARHACSARRFRPALPATKAQEPPSGPMWLHEIKHDGFRVIARKDDKRVRLYSRPGNDLTRRFPLIVDALSRLRSRSCIIDGEAVACDENGVASFNLIRYRRHDDTTFLYAFDLIEQNGDDLRHDPLEVRKAALASVVAKAGPGIRFNRTHGRRRPDRLRPCLQAWPGRHRLEAQGFRLPFRALARLAQNEESGLCGGEARSGGGLGAVEGCRQERRGKHGLGPKHGAEHLP